MLSKEQNDEECDATDDASSNTAGQQNTIVIASEAKQKNLPQSRDEELIK